MKTEVRGDDMGKRKEAERHFAKSLRAPVTFTPKVATSITRLEEQRRIDNVGIAVLIAIVMFIPIVAFVECLRVVS